MSLLTYNSGDCGLGYFRSIFIVNILVLLSFVPNMVVILSWLVGGGIGTIALPIILENAFVIPAWLSGALCIIPGFIALFSRSHAQRNILLNVWVVSIGIYSILITAAGIYLVYKIAEDRNIADALFNVAIEKTSKNLPNPIKPGSATDNALHRLKGYGLQVGFWFLYKALPYPASAIFFLYWQIGLTSFAFCVIPSLMSFWAFYHALGNRNYFAKNPDAFHDQSIAEGPIESDSEDESSSEESDISENEGESVPFSKRHYENRSEATLVQSARSSPTRRANAVRGRVV